MPAWMSGAADAPRNRLWRHAVLGTTAVVLVGLVSACGSSGRELRPPAEGITAPERSTTIVEEPADTEPPETQEQPPTTQEPALALASPAWAGEEPLPAVYTCEGEDISPPLAWSGTPEDISTMAITMIDPGDGYVHWIVVGVDPALEGFAQDSLPQGAEELANDADQSEWLGPCPPPGEVGEYELRLLAFTEAPSLPEATPAEMVSALHETAESESVLTVRYERSS